MFEEHYSPSANVFSVLTKKKSKVDRLENREREKKEKTKSISRAIFNGDGGITHTTVPESALGRLSFAIYTSIIHNN